VPIEVLAYQLYRDTERADEILARNPWIDDPGAVPGGKPIEVLDA
jgi:prophage DNA circulation protein